MITLIQKREAELFLELKRITLTFGEGSILHQKTRSEWVGVHKLMVDLGIKHDIHLPESREAIKMVLEQDQSK